MWQQHSPLDRERLVHHATSRAFFGEEERGSDAENKEQVENDENDEGVANTSNLMVRKVRKGGRKPGQPLATLDSITPESCESARHLEELDSDCDSPVLPEPPPLPMSASGQSRCGPETDGASSPTTPTPTEKPGRVLRAVVRIRPDQEGTSTCACIDERTISVSPPPMVPNSVTSSSSRHRRTHSQSSRKLAGPQLFRFDRVLGPSATQQEVFDATASEMVDLLLCHQDSALFSYGVTNSGKTYTTVGPPGILDELPSLSLAPGALPPHTGIIARALSKLCSKMAQLRITPDRERQQLWFSCLELYNDRPVCLLSGSKCSVAEAQGCGRMAFKNLQHEPFYGTDEAHLLLARALASRTVVETSCNRTSSRSHTVFTISLCAKSTKSSLALDRAPEFDLRNVRSQMAIIDMAGIERNSNEPKGDRNGDGIWSGGSGGSGSSGGRHQQNRTMRETSEINKSLMHLTNCLRAINRRSRNSNYPASHFRDTKLTHILKPFLSGSAARVVMMINVHPGAGDYDEKRIMLREVHDIVTGLNLSQRGVPNYCKNRLQGQNTSRQQVQVRSQERTDKLQRTLRILSTFNAQRQRFLFLRDAFDRFRDADGTPLQNQVAHHPQTPSTLAEPISQPREEGDMAIKFMHANAEYLKGQGEIKRLLGKSTSLERQVEQLRAELGTFAQRNALLERECEQLRSAYCSANTQLDEERSEKERIYEKLEGEQRRLDRSTDLLNRLCHQRTLRHIVARGSSMPDRRAGESGRSEGSRERSAEMYAVLAGVDPAVTVVQEPLSPHPQVRRKYEDRLASITGGSGADAGNLVDQAEWEEVCHLPPRLISNPAIENCKVCNQHFDDSHSQMHCRSCGYPCCRKCTRNRMALPWYGYPSKVVVCDTCYGLFPREGRE